MSTLDIRTPEGIRFSLQLASPVSRGLALVIDLACISVLIFGLGFTTMFLGVISDDLAHAVYILAYFVLSICYGIFLEWVWSGQTIGKKLLGLQVVDSQGLRLQFSQIAFRNLMRFIDCLPVFYLVGGIACFVNRHVQRLGDVAAGTVVIKLPILSQPNLDLILPGKFNSFRRYPHLAARLRQSTPPALADVALQALLRRDQFDPAERAVLLQEIAERFRSIVAFPEDEVRDLPHEQYLRNVVEILFRSHTMDAADVGNAPEKAQKKEKQEK